VWILILRNLIDKDMKKYAKLKKYALAGNLPVEDVAGRYNQEKIGTTNGGSALGKDVGASTYNVNFNKVAPYAALAATGVSAYSNISNNQDLTAQQKADSYYDTGKAIGSSINPIVGAAWQVGDSIGEPIKARSEELNYDGTLKDKNKAQRNAVIGGIFNPLKALTQRSAYGGWGDITGKGYVNDLEAQGQAAYAEEQAKIAAEQEAERQREYQERMNYSKAYNLVNPITGREGASIYAKGGNLVQSNYSSPDGQLKRLASTTTKAIGSTHENGGIELQSNSKPIAEIEDQEIIDGTKVYSDRLKFKPGVTFAKQAEKLGKQKGKYEEMLDSSNYREKNTANRMLSNIDSDLEGLFNLQESKKPKVQPVGLPLAAGGVDLNDYSIYKPSRGKLTPEEYIEEEKYANPDGRFAKVDWNRIGQNITPYLDNIYNQQIINATPNIPTPTNRVAYDLNPVTLRTNYNIAPALNDAERAYQSFNKDINENTANSVTARGNKLAAFSNLLTNKSKLYNTKENIETDLINKNNMNVQQVSGANTGNRQNITNQNAALTDNFNLMKMQRNSDMNKMRTANYANAIDNMTTQIQDRNMEDVDQSRIMTDALRYNDSAGLARLVGSPVMTTTIRSNPQYYYQVEKSLKASGQNDALRDFYKTYGRKSN
jgi:hypothetical protein